ncbi:hypothetical protein Ate02nite_04870 [Paractinoplanes tereljensis]|uniref:Uncharacterized protein n=1 Tax=Paractinoplanes tereljensis TaxID=571912 RepID=A0A919NH85_9ACTN|nr:hypothetical protein Ate02nite_04870 [Actinoplanes tereljensis]
MIGLAAVLGGGAYAITSTALGDNSTKPPSVGMIDAVPVSSAATAKLAGPERPKNGAKTSTGSAAIDESDIETPEERIKAAREAATKDGVGVKHPRTQETVTVKDDGGVVESNSGSLKTGGSMRIVSAPFDLTGRRELAWVAGKGRKVGNAECTDKIQLSNEDKPETRPMMLLCWRTSATKSVVTVAVVPKGRPNAATSVAELNKQWAKMR